jgi:hypothetical protein
MRQKGGGNRQVHYSIKTFSSNYFLFLLSTKLGVVYNWALYLADIVGGKTTESEN